MFDDLINCQICLLKENILSIKELQVFDFILVKFRSFSCICRVLLDNNETDSIYFSLLVSNRIISNRSKHFKLNGGSSLILEKLNKLQQLEEVNIDIIVENITDKISMENMSNLHFYCQSLLLNLCVGNNFYINLGSSKLTSHFKIRHILINLPAANKEWYGYITNKTKITLNQIRLFRDITLRSINFNQFESHIEKLLNIISVKREDLLFIPSIILWGPPSCGKSTLVQLCSSLKNYLLFLISSIDIFKSVVEADNYGCLVEKLTEIRQLCQNGQKCILFFKNLEEFVAKDRTIREIINEVVNYNIESEKQNLIVIASTINLSNIDIKFDYEILVGYPNFEDRKCIIKNIFEKSNFQMEIFSNNVQSNTISNVAKIYNFERIASKTSGFSVGELINFLQNAIFMEAIENNPLDENAIDRLLCEQGPSRRCSDIYVDNSIQNSNWDDLIGCQDLKKELTEAIIWPLMNPMVYREFGLSVDGGILLHGPPGCGKTMIVRALASRLAINFIPLSAAQLYSPYLGDSEKRLMQIFATARSCAPSLIFIDEIDSVVGGCRGESVANSDAHQRVLTSLLTQMDGVGDRLCTQTWQEDTIDEHRVILVAASNRPALIDPALRRRFNRVIYVGPPDLESRLSILEKYTKEMTMVGVDLNLLAENTENFTGADLENLCKKAFMLALTNSTDFENILITKEDFQTSLLTTKPSIF